MKPKAFIKFGRFRQQIPLVVRYCVEYEGKSRMVFMDDEGRYIWVGSDKIRVTINEEGESK